MKKSLQRLPTIEQIKQEQARRTYWRYVEYTHEGRWIPSRHLLYTCNQIQQFIEQGTGHSYDILILQMPPQHGKSMSTTETLPSWYLGKYPNRRVILASYNDETAERFTRRNKEKIKQFGKAIFSIEISKQIDRATEFELTNNVGRMISRGIMGGITSNPANLVLIDDPVKNRQEADSETFRERSWEEWQNSIKTRLSAGAKVIVIMTRWHEDDLAGRIIANEKNVRVINLPCEAEDNDPLGRKPGEALFPEIGKDNAWLEEFKVGYQTAEGKRAWLALFQGRPTAEEGNMIKRSWWKYYKQKPNRFDQVLQSWDCTFKDSDGSDYVVGQVWGRVGADKYLLDQVRDRMDLPTTINAILTLTAKWPQARLKLIEDKANGPAVIQILHKKVGGMVAVNPEGGKIARASAVSPHIEAGNVYLPEAEWIHDFIEECSAFPNGKHDDQVDAMTQALNRMISDYSTYEPPKKSIPWPFNTEEPDNGGFMTW